MFSLECHDYKRWCHSNCQLKSKRGLNSLPRWIKSLTVKSLVLQALLLPGLTSDAARTEKAKKCTRVGPESPGCTLRLQPRSIYVLQATKQSQDIFGFWPVVVWKLQVLGWCKSNCSSALLKFTVWYWNLFLNKCGYVIHHYNAHFLVHVFFFANDLLLVYVFYFYFRLGKWC